MIYSLGIPERRVCVLCESPRYPSQRSFMRHTSQKHNAGFVRGNRVQTAESSLHLAPAAPTIIRIDSPGDASHTLTPSWQALSALAVRSPYSDRRKSPPKTIKWLEEKVRSTTKLLPLLIWELKTEVDLQKFPAVTM